MKNFKRLFGILTVGMAVALMTACGGNPDQNAQSQDESSSASASTSSSSSSSATMETQAQTQPGSKLNLNTATEEEFLTIPDVGDRMVHEFFEYRPYISIQQFRREIGKYVDEEQVAAYEEYVFVPIDPNESDAATLQQIPGLDESEANELIGARPFDSADAFLEQLSSYVSEDELSTAESYLTTE